MAFSKIYSAQTVGLRARMVDVEIDVSDGLHSFIIVGLPDKAVEESRDRVGSAIKNAGFSSPKHSNQKVVISLAPASLRKEGPLFDLAIALAYLKAKNYISFDPARKLFLGELSLDGYLRPVNGALLLAQCAKKAGFTEIFVPKESASEAALVDGITVFGARHLSEVIAHLDPEIEDARALAATPHTAADASFQEEEAYIDIADIKGQETAKRALEIAAAGGHNIAFYGPPGTGKTMLAKAFRFLLPALSLDEALEATSIHSVAGSLDKPLVAHPPFRAPHHTASYVSVLGGGTIPKPGEATLAHNGVLFLDEFPEFDRRVIESLREPLEERKVSIARARGTEVFPARFILIAAMNPCPCGNATTNKQCSCSPGSLSKYRRKLSGPIIDRIDLWVHVPRIEHEKLFDKEKEGATTEELRLRIASARNRQRTRFENHSLSFYTNADMDARTLNTVAPLLDEPRAALAQAAKQFDLSPRSMHRLIKVARTIADLHGADSIEHEYLFEALQYRPKQLFTDT